MSGHERAGANRAGALRGVLPVFQTSFRADEEIDPGALAAETAITNGS